MRTNVEVVLVRAIYVCCMSCGRYARAGAISSSVFRVVFLLCSVGVCLSGLYNGALVVPVNWRQKHRLFNEKICVTIRLIKSVISTHTRRNSTFGRDVLRQVQEEGYS